MLGEISQTTESVLLKKVLVDKDIIFRQEKFAVSDLSLDFWVMLKVFSSKTERFQKFLKHFLARFEWLQ